MTPFASGYEVLCCWSTRGGGFQGLPSPGSASFPFTPPALTRSIFVKSWSAWVCHVGWRRWLWCISGQNKKTCCKNRFPWARESLPWQEPLIKMSCLETQTVPSKMLLSYRMSFLLRKEHTLLHVRKGRNKLSTLGGSSLQHKPKFHFALKEKQGPNLPLSFMLLLKAMGFLSTQAYVSMMVWMSCYNEENCVLGSRFCRHQITALFSTRAPVHFYLTKKEITHTVFRTL